MVLTHVGGVHVWNPNLAERRSTSYGVIPFEPGQVASALLGRRIEGDDGREAQWQMLGPLYPDGSVKRALVHVEQEWPAGEPSKAVQLYVNPQLEEGSSSWIASELPGVLGDYRCDAWINGEVAHWEPQQEWIVDAGPLAWSILRHARVPGTPWWAEVVQVFYKGMPYSDFAFSWGMSNTAGCPWNADLNELRLVLSLGKLEMKDRSFYDLEETVTPVGHTIVLERGERYGASQGGMIEGQVVHLPGALGDLKTAVASELPTVAFGERWGQGPRDAAIGLHGVKPERPPAGAPPDVAALQRADWCVGRSIGWDRGRWRRSDLNCFPEPGSTGDQPGFGILWLRELYHARGVSQCQLQAEAARHHIQEARRARTHREAGGGLASQLDHRHAYLWADQPNTRVGGDHLGLHGSPPWGYEHREDGSRPQQKFAGYDWEHYSSGSTSELAVLSGRPSLLRLSEWSVETWLMNFNHSQGVNAHVRAPRAHGRAIETGLWLYEVTGDERLATAILTRLRLWRDQCWRGPELLVTQVVDPHATNIAGEPWWMPWQEAMVSNAHRAALRLLGHRMDSALREGLVRDHEQHLESIARGGWGRFGATETSIHTAKAVAWNGGRPVDPMIHTGPNGRVNLYGGYDTWMAPATAQAREHLAGDPAELARVFWAQCLARRDPTNWGDVWSRWMCVEPDVPQYVAT